MGIGPQNLGAGGGKTGHTPCGHKKQISPLNKNGKASGTSGGDPAFRLMHDAVKENDKKQISPFNKVSAELKEIREKPGMSNAGKYNVKDYAGPNKSYPINDIDRGRSAIKLAYKAGPKLEKQIKENVYKKYPSLEPDNKSKNA